MSLRESVTSRSQGSLYDTGCLSVNQERADGLSALRESRGRRQPREGGLYPRENVGTFSFLCLLLNEHGKGVLGTLGEDPASQRCPSSPSAGGGECAALRLLKREELSQSAPLASVKNRPPSACAAVPVPPAVGLLPFAGLCASAFVPTPRRA